MQAMLYQGRFVFRYLHIVFFSLFFSIAFLFLGVLENRGFIILFVLSIIVSYIFIYVSLPGNLIISDRGFFLKKKFLPRRKIFDIGKITDAVEFEYNNNPSLFSMLVDLFSNLSFLSIYKDQQSFVLEITDQELAIYRIYSYQTIHYNEVKMKLFEIVSVNKKYNPPE